MLMKFLIIVTVLFLFSLPVFAGTFLDTFEDGNLDGWRELVLWDREPGSWEIIAGGLHGSVDDGYPRLFTTGITHGRITQSNSMSDPLKNMVAQLFRSRRGFRRNGW